LIQPIAGAIQGLMKWKFKVQGGPVQNFTPFYRKTVTFLTSPKFSGWATRCWGM